MRNANDENYLWGTTSGGGSDWGSYGCGTVFKMHTGGFFDFQTVYQFPGTDTSAAMCRPNSLTVTAAGRVYGTTRNGAVFEIVPSGAGHDANVLYTFSADDALKGVLATSYGALIGVARELEVVDTSSNYSRRGRGIPPGKNPCCTASTTTLTGAIRAV